MEGIIISRYKYYIYTMYSTEISLFASEEEEKAQISREHRKAWKHMSAYLFIWLPPSPSPVPWPLQQKQQWQARETNNGSKRRERERERERKEQQGRGRKKERSTNNGGRSEHGTGIQDINHIIQ
jgi:hypothetical protein